jgi:hypothetical protein
VIVVKVFCLNFDLKYFQNKIYGRSFADTAK